MPSACQCVITAKIFCFVIPAPLVRVSCLFPFFFLQPNFSFSRSLEIGISWKIRIIKTSLISKHPLIFHTLNYASSWLQKYNHIFAWPFACPGDVRCSMLNAGWRKMHKILHFHCQTPAGFFQWPSKNTIVCGSL